MNGFLVYNYIEQNYDKKLNKKGCPKTTFFDI